MPEGREKHEVLVLAPTMRDAELTRTVLERAEVVCLFFTEIEELCTHLSDQTGAVILPEESLGQRHVEGLVCWLGEQETWSDLPLLVMARPGADSLEMAQAMELLGNVTVLERPMRVASLVSAVRSALRARSRQFQIREHLVERERAEDQLRLNDRRKDEFLAMLAHELRNPLAPIRNSLHILRLTESNNPAAASIGPMMERQVNHMVRLVDDLMEVSRITRGAIDLHLERVNIGSIVRAAVETSRPLIEASRHTLQMELPAAPLLLECDPVRLAQVLSNLLNNAAKYTPPGGHIALTVRLEDRTAVISVRDTGLGMPAEMLPRVFELFTQIDRHAGLAQGGLGIGLTLVKRIVELHGGSVVALSEGLDQGSEFLIRIPIPAHSSRAVEPPMEVVPRRLAHRRVLVVDDNRDAGESLGTLLELLGADVRVVTSGADALRSLPEYDPAVVLLDIGMPGMDGHEVARWIREQPRYDELTVIALTGWGQEEDRRLSREAGFDYHLVKPADVNALQLLFLSLESGAAAGSGRTGT